MRLKTQHQIAAVIINNDNLLKIR